MGDGRWGGPDTGGGRLNTRLWTERRQKGRKERGDRNALEGKNPGDSWMGGKRKGPKPSRKGIHRNLNIGTESRGNLSLCSGLELHHPIISKLWNLGGQTERKRIYQ